MMSSKNRFLGALLIFLSVVGNNLYGQEKVKVIDPDISFTYTLPDGWVYENSDYYYYIYKPASDRGLAPRISITYFEGRCLELKDCHEADFFALKQEFMNMTPGNTKDDLIGNIPAKWSTFSFVDEEKNDRKGILYTFIDKNQYFVILATATKEEFEAVQAKFLQIIRSLKVSSNR